MRPQTLLDPRKYISLGRRLIQLRPVCGSLLAGRVRRIPMDCIVNEFAFSFAGTGWNYFRALVAEHEKDPGVKFEDSTFCKFFRDERVRAIRYLNDVLFLHDPLKRNRGGDYKFYLGTYPWGDHVGGGPWGMHHDAVEGKSTRDIYGYRGNIWHEPGDLYPLEWEWKKTIAIYHSLKSGYHPIRCGSFPEVTLLLRNDGAMRAMRYNGQHRLAAASQLGVRKITAVIPTASEITRSLEDWPSVSSLPKLVHEREIVVRESEVSDWYYVRQGLCSAEQALEIFHAFFNLNGRERIEHLGLPSVY
jgi:hypothetical protein